MENRSLPARPPGAIGWIFLLGGLGFAAGFFGPLIFNPDSNQGPLVGILISGPGGALLGLLLYGITQILHVSAARQWQILWTFGSALALATLYICLPGPALRGYALEIQIDACKAPAEMTESAIAYWEKRVAAATWASPRPNWQDEARRLLRDVPAVVLDATVLRRISVYESRKPWDRGSLSTKGWSPSSEHTSYYAAYAGGSCAEYPAGSRSVRFLSYPPAGLTRSAQDWPPRDPAGFLNLAPLELVPVQYQDVIGH
jgi:hypothetical protein